jgi:general secretion pathway protein B
MSYILDALKKAETERNPDASVNARTMPEMSAFIPPPAQIRAPRNTPWLWPGMTAVAIAIAALAWLKPWQQQSAQVAAAPLPPAPAVAAQAPPAPPPLAAAPAETTAPPPRVAKADTPPAAKSESRKAAPAKQAAEKRPAKSQASSGPVPAKQAKPEPAAPPGNDARIASVQELPVHIQTEIPRLAVTGYIYSPNKAERTVLINGRLLREGEQVAPGLVLEQLTQSGMVLSYKGYRYRTSY